MRRLRLTDQAVVDLAAIARYIAEASGDRGVADRFSETLLARCQRLAALPGLLGRARPELRTDIRSLTVGSYLIFFRYNEDEVEITEIVHGSRDIEGYFSEV